jgi:putative peptidoglycan lipid II flippase
VTAPTDEAVPAPVAEGRRPRLARSTAIFSLATGLSRILGLVREIVARSYFGTVGAINAFEVAFLIPNTVRSLVADSALSSAFVPVFSELLVKGERKRAWRVASSLFWLVLLGLGGLTALFIVISPWIMAAFGYGDLAVGLARVLFPIVVLLGLSGIVVGILNSYDHFTVPALTPVVWNIAIIAGLLIGVPRADGIDAKLYVYAFSILIATVIQFLLPLPWLRGRDGRLQVVIDWRDPGVRQTLVLMVPITIGLGLINLNAVVDTFFAARLIDKFHAVSAINAAFRLYMLPQGMFSVAVATVLFPSLARLATAADFDGFRRTVTTGIRQIAFLLIPASIVCAVLAEPLVRVIYQHYNFTAAQTPAVAHSLAAFSVGLVFNGFMLMLNRAFFSLQSAWIPTLVALGNLGLNAVLDAAFYSLGIWGLPLSTSLVNIAGAAALFILLRRRLGRLDLHDTTRAVVRILVASAVLGAVSYGVWRPLHDSLGDAFGPALLALLAALTAGGAAYIVSCRLLGVRELDALLSLVRSRASRG